MLIRGMGNWGMGKATRKSTSIIFVYCMVFMCVYVCVCVCVSMCSKKWFLNFSSVELLSLKWAPLLMAYQNDHLLYIHTYIYNFFVGKLPAFLMRSSDYHNRRFNLGGILDRSATKGFTSLNMTEDTSELDHLNSDSEVEEFNATPMKAWIYCVCIFIQHTEHIYVNVLQQNHGSISRGL